MAHLCSTKQNEDKSSQNFVKRWGQLSYKCPDAPSHKFIVGLCKRNLKAEVRSLIVGIRTKMIAQLIEAIAEAEEFSQNSKKILRR